MSHNKSTVSLDTYKRKKIIMLERDFYIRLTPEDRAYIWNLKSDIEVDQHSITLIKRRLGED